MWIMAAAGLFLLVVIGAAVLLYSPAKDGGEQRATPADFDPGNGWSSEGLSAIGVSSLSDGTSIADAPFSPFEGADSAAGENSGESADSYSFDLDNLNFASSDTASSGSSGSSDKLLDGSVFASDSDSSGDSSGVIDLNKVAPSSNVSAQNDYTAAQIENAKDGISSSANSSAPSASSISEKKSPAYSSKSVSAQTSTSSSRALYVQVGSFEDSSKADKARGDLEKKGYRNVSIFTLNDGGKTMYRVRLGPYSSKSEADSACAEISKIKDFKESYVTDPNAKKVN